MKVLLINIDSKIPNLALKKIEKYHLDKGDEVAWDFPLYRHLVDKIYVSCIFERNRHKCNEWEGIASIGGSGYNLTTELPKEIENIKPKINLGFTTRGCIRNCKFCIVPQKEGKVRVTGDLHDLWNGKSKDIILLDNNILALPDHFKYICWQARQHNIRLDFNQGLDCRLLSEEIMKELEITNLRDIRFAFDDLKYMDSVKKTIGMLNKFKVRKNVFWYIIVGFNTTIEEDLIRINYLRKHKQRCYVMRYNSDRKDRELMKLARWVNMQAWFQSITWEQFLERNYPRG